VREIPVRTGDRLLRYTDGLIEPQNAKGEYFGDRKLEEVIRRNQSLPSGELMEQLLVEIRAWQPAALPQQDNITLMLIDVGYVLLFRCRRPINEVIIHTAATAVNICAGDCVYP
jgi:serine phosphatase RsbU (regulator of sigma subunit)